LKKGLQAGLPGNTTNTRDPEQERADGSGVTNWKWDMQGLWVTRKRFMNVR